MEHVQDRRRLGRRGTAAIAAGLVVAVSAVVATATLRSDGPPTIRLAATGGATLAADEAGDAAMERSDLAIWHPVEHRFELRDGARLPAGEAAAWQLHAPADLRGAAERLARGLGVDDLRPAPYDEASLVAGVDDWTGPSLWVGATGDWFYSAPSGSVLWDCAAPEETIVHDTSDAEDDVLPTECATPEPPSGVPSVTEARQLATDLFAELEVPGSVVLADVSADEWSAWASGSVVLDGAPTDLSVHANWGGDAALTSLNGTLASVVRVADYPTIDTDQAVERLQEQSDGWAGVARGEPMPLPAVDPLEDAAADQRVAMDATVSSDDVEELDPSLVTPLPAPTGDLEVVTVTLVGVERVLQLHHDVDGTMWLLPGYRFTAEDGGTWQVLALGDEHVQTEEPPAVEEPLPVDPPVGEPGKSEPGMSEPGDPGDPDGVEPEPGVDPGEPIDDLGLDPEVRRAVETLVGATEEEAQRMADELGLEVRVVERDGEHLGVTDDWRTDRLNLGVEAGIVTRAALG